MKVIDRIEQSLGSDEGRIVFSFEYFTPKPGHGTAEAFLSTVSAMSAHGPSFCDITWRPREPYPAVTLDLAGRMQADLGIDTMMHLTCVGMPRDRIDHALDTARAKGVHNILALRGDFLPGIDANGDGDGFSSGLDLVKYIRAKHGDYFGICVAGYPEAHPSQIPDGSESATEEGYEADLDYLKKKVDAGADFIITQLFFDAQVFIKFMKDCRRIGIKCPIIPGILPITTYRNFKFMTETCKTKVPKEVRAAVEAAKGDDARLAAYGVELATDICRRILEETGIRALHFYTMNKEAPAVGVLRNLGLAGGGKENGGKIAETSEHTNFLFEHPECLKLMATLPASFDSACSIKRPAKGQKHLHILNGADHLPNLFQQSVWPQDQKAFCPACSKLTRKLHTEALVAIDG